jgi:hypothetical protein
MAKKKPVGLYNGALQEIPTSDFLDANIQAFSFDQTVPSASWVINHNLNRYPTVVVKDSAGTVVVGTVTYDDENTISLSFTGGFAGTAYLT